MGLFGLFSDNKSVKKKKKASSIKHIEDELRYVYGYSEKKLSKMSDREKIALWDEEQDWEDEGL